MAAGKAQQQAKHSNRTWAIEEEQKKMEKPRSWSEGVGVCRLGGRLVPWLYIFGQPHLVMCEKKNKFCSVEITTATSCAAESYRDKVFCFFYFAK